MPATLAIIFGLIFLVFRRASEAAIHHGQPATGAGRRHVVDLAMGHAVSVATLIGFIALAGVAAESASSCCCICVTPERQLAANPKAGEADDAADREGAVQGVRLKAMTVAVILAGGPADDRRRRRL